MSAEIFEAFEAESQRLAVVAAETDEAGFARPSPCVSWTAADLLYHVRMVMGWLEAMLAAPEPAGFSLVTAAGYYRAGQQALELLRTTPAGRVVRTRHGDPMRLTEFDSKRSWKSYAPALI